MIGTAMVHFGPQEFQIINITKNSGIRIKADKILGTQAQQYDALEFRTKFGIELCC
jgi:hypothetical protein